MSRHGSRSRCTSPTQPCASPPAPPQTAADIEALKREGGAEAVVRALTENSASFASKTEFSQASMHAWVLPVARAVCERGSSSPTIRARDSRRSTSRRRCASTWCACKCSAPRHAPWQRRCSSRTPGAWRGCVWSRWHSSWPSPTWARMPGPSSSVRAKRGTCTPSALLPEDRHW